MRVPSHRWPCGLHTACRSAPLVLPCAPGSPVCPARPHRRAASWRSLVVEVVEGPGKRREQLPGARPALGPLSRPRSGRAEQPLRVFPRGSVVSPNPSSAGAAEVSAGPPPRTWFQNNLPAHFPRQAPCAVPAAAALPGRAESPCREGTALSPGPPLSPSGARQIAGQKRTPCRSAPLSEPRAACPAPARDSAPRETAPRLTSSVTATVQTHRSLARPESRCFRQEK